MGSVWNYIPDIRQVFVAHSHLDTAAITAPPSSQRERSRLPRPPLSTRERESERETHTEGERETERERGGMNKPAGGRRLIFTSSRRISQHLPCMLKAGIPRRSWPADPVASKQEHPPAPVPRIPPPCPPRPAAAHRISAIQPWPAHPNTSPSCLIHPRSATGTSQVSVCPPAALCIRRLTRDPTDDEGMKPWTVTDGCDARGASPSGMQDAFV